MTFTSMPRTTINTSIGIKTKTKRTRNRIKTRIKTRIRTKTRTKNRIKNRTKTRTKTRKTKTIKTIIYRTYRPMTFIRMITTITNTSIGIKTRTGPIRPIIQNIWANDIYKYD